MNRRQFVAGLLGTAAVCSLAPAVHAVTIEPRQPPRSLPKGLEYIGCTPHGARILDLASFGDQMFVLTADGPYLFDGRTWEPVAAVNGEQYVIVTDFYVKAERA